MITRISHITLLVRDQDEALAWYTGKLDFEKRVDTVFDRGFRWLTVAPRGQAHPQIVLQKPVPELHGEGWKELMRHVGLGTACVLETDDCRRDYRELSARGVKFTGAPQDMFWGVQAVFSDLYGNPFVLVEPRGFA